MKYTLIEILSGTPWWVYAIFLYLMFIGIRNLYTRTMPLIQLAIMPLFFLSWSLYSLVGRYGVNAATGSIWSSAIAIGFCIGWLIARKTRLTFDIKRRLVTLPGSWITLTSALLFFVGKYYINFSYATNPLAKGNILFIGADLMLSGFISGFAFGRLFCFFARFYKAMEK